MKILIVGDARFLRDTAPTVTHAGHSSENVGSASLALPKLRETPFDLLLLDLRQCDADSLGGLRELRRSHPDLPIITVADRRPDGLADAPLHVGASDHLDRPFSPGRLRHAIARSSKVAAPGPRDHLSQASPPISPPADFVSEDPRMAHVYDALFHTMRSSKSLLIVGEPGVGKTLLARAVHDRSHLSGAAFVAVDGRNLSDPRLDESGLFGGEAVPGGTLFFHEIGALPLEIQPRLLRLLQEQENSGSSAPGPARIIATTNRDLAAAVAVGTFREDLFHRLNVGSVTIPPLRQRPGDIPRLAGRFLEFFARQTGSRAETISADALPLLLAYAWPGNVRELRNVVERAVLLGRGRELAANDFFQPGAANSTTMPGLQVGSLVSIEEIERLHIERVLDIADTQEAAARILGIDPATLYRKRKKWSALIRPVDVAPSGALL